MTSRWLTVSSGVLEDETLPSSFSDDSISLGLGTPVATSTETKGPVKRDVDVEGRLLPSFSLWESYLHLQSRGATESTHETQERVKDQQDVGGCDKPVPQSGGRSLAYIPRRSPLAPVSANEGGERKCEQENSAVQHNTLSNTLEESSLGILSLSDMDDFMHDLVPFQSKKCRDSNSVLLALEPDAHPNFLGSPGTQDLALHHRGSESVPEGLRGLPDEDDVTELQKYNFSLPELPGFSNVSATAKFEEFQRPSMWLAGGLLRDLSRQASPDDIDNYLKSSKDLLDRGVIRNSITPLSVFEGWSSDEEEDHIPETSWHESLPEVGAREDCKVGDPVKSQMDSPPEGDTFEKSKSGHDDVTNQDEEVEQEMQLSLREIGPSRISSMYFCPATHLDSKSIVDPPPWDEKSPASSNDVIYKDSEGHWVTNLAYYTPLEQQFGTNSSQMGHTGLEEEVFMCGNEGKVMFEEDEEQFKNENPFFEVAKANETPDGSSPGLDDSWGLHHASHVTLRASQAPSDFDGIQEANGSFLRLSLGEFFGHWSNALGHFGDDGSDCKRPSWGNTIFSPERRPPFSLIRPSDTSNCSLKDGTHEREASVIGTQQMESLLEDGLLDTEKASRETRAETPANPATQTMSLPNQMPLPGTRITSGERRVTDTDESYLHISSIATALTQASIDSNPVELAAMIYDLSKKHFNRFRGAVVGQVSTQSGADVIKSPEDAGVSPLLDNARVATCPPESPVAPADEDDGKTLHSAVCHRLEEEQQPAGCDPVTSGVISAESRPTHGQQEDSSAVAHALMPHSEPVLPETSQFRPSSSPLSHSSPGSAEQSDPSLARLTYMSSDESTLTQSISLKDNSQEDFSSTIISCSTTPRPEEYVPLSQKGQISSGHPKTSSQPSCPSCLPVVPPHEQRPTSMIDRVPSSVPLPTLTARPQSQIPFLVPTVSSPFTKHILHGVPNYLAGPSIECSVLVPDVYALPESCCVGIAAQGTLGIRNPTEGWLDVSLHLLSVSINGKVEESAQSCLIFNGRVIMAPHTTRDVPLMFVPHRSGSYRCELSAVPSPAGQPNFVFFNPRMARVMVIAVAEDPHVKLMAMQGEALDFGDVMRACVKALPVRVISWNRCTIPVRLFISAGAVARRCFMLCRTPPGPDLSADASFLSAPSILSVVLDGATDLAPASTTVWVVFGTPPCPIQPFVPLGPPESFIGRLDVQLDHPGSCVPLASLQLSGRTGIVRLHAPQHMQNLVFNTTPERMIRQHLPLKNAGNIMLDLDLKVSQYEDSFSVRPTSLRLLPGAETVVEVNFTPGLCSGEALNSVLLLSVCPTGPTYEVMLCGQVADPTTQRPLSPSFLEIPPLLSNRQYLSWGGVTLGRAQQIKVILRNSSDNQTLNLRLIVRGPDQDCFQLQNRFGREELLGSSMELQLRQHEDATVRLLFTPTRHACLLAKLDIKQLAQRTSVHGVKFTIPLTGYGGMSHLVVEGATTTPDGYSLALRLDPGGSSHFAHFRLHNTGSRAAFVRAVVYKTRRMLRPEPEEFEVVPDCFVLKEHHHGDVTITCHCDMAGDAAATICFFYGDEISRMMYKRWCKTSWPDHPIDKTFASLTPEDFNCHFRGEENITEVYELPEHSEDGSTFFSQLRKVLVSMIPGSSTSASLATTKSLESISQNVVVEGEGQVSKRHTTQSFESISQNVVVEGEGQVSKRHTTQSLESISQNVAGEGGGQVSKRHASGIKMKNLFPDPREASRFGASSKDSMGRGQGVVTATLGPTFGNEESVNGQHSDALEHHGLADSKAIPAVGGQVSAAGGQVSSVGSDQFGTMRQSLIREKLGSVGKQVLVGEGCSFVTKKQPRESGRSGSFGRHTQAPEDGDFVTRRYSPREGLRSVEKWTPAAEENQGFVTSRRCSKIDDHSSLTVKQSPAITTRECSVNKRQGLDTRAQMEQISGAPSGQHSGEHKRDSNTVGLDVLPVRGPQTESVAVGADEPQLSWSMKPEQIVLSPNSPGELVLKSLSSCPLPFDLSWPAHCLDVCPQHGVMLPWQTQRIVVSHKPLPAIQPGSHLWNGHLSVHCDGRQQTVSVKVEESLDTLKKKKDPPQPSSPSRTDVNPPVPISIPTLEPSSSIMFFPSTPVGRSSEVIIEFENRADTSTKWYLSSTGPANIQDLESRRKVNPVSYNVFHLRSLSGNLLPGSTGRVPVAFLPREVGRYTQFWDLKGQAQSRGKANGKQIQLFAESFAEPEGVAGISERPARTATGIPSQPQIPSSVSAQPQIPSSVSAQLQIPSSVSAQLQIPSSVSAQPQIPSSVSAQPQIPSSVSAEPRIPSSFSQPTSNVVMPSTRCRVADVYLAQDIFHFDAIPVSTRCTLKVPIRNSTDHPHQLKFIHPQKPFRVKYSRYSIRPQHYVNLPVQFCPDRAGLFEGQLVIEAGIAGNLVAHLRGEAYTKASSDQQVCPQPPAATARSHQR
uniref:centrosomal protein of 192 kDa-like isoform X2 n=1 Tax=Myxine glutinosa TaxID=7769 RepID=UPI00358DF1D0